MMNATWRSVIGTIAPALATLLGGPLAGGVVAELSQSLLGRPDGSEAEVAAAVQSGTPDVLLKIKAVEAALKTKFIDGGLDWERITASDRADARAMQIQTRSKMPAYLGVLAIVTFFGMLAALWLFGLPKEPQLAGILIMAFGMMRDEVKAIYSFCFGTTASSSDKNDLLRQALNGHQ